MADMIRRLKRQSSSDSNKSTKSSKSLAEKGKGVALMLKGKDRETSDPSETAQNEQNNKPWTVPGDQISDIIWRGSK